ncbi:monovalent cation/H(+) antiporter subunit G [Pseudoduganella umbonata]|uniref:Cation:proton antiporter n=1 Tax=Pseudoduganella umbonata TaxID=864828 RepID=A0A4P8HW84_9BURK|nr:monovalent cation/H(+) antiporter subunit G [Pseudoduganella umbonata]MBB3221920.1 multicomponent K+:H+ antiporter subunit G [Pseudoduganella umbonata]QCP14283.1 cation:proton antiporter [Pseudoduganella umbonata]
MSGIEHLPGWAALPVALLLVLGATIILIGALGLLRLRTFYQRMHGPAITVTLGAGCLLLASMLYFTVAQSRLVIHEIIISVFLLLTAPVVAMTIMRAAVYRDLRARKRESGVTAGEVYILSDSGKEVPPEPR